MFTWVYLVVGVAAGLITYKTLMARSDSQALVGSLLAGVLWYIWAQASWTVETASAGEVVTSSYPELAIVGYVAAVAMAGAAVLAAVETLDLNINW